MIDQIMPRVSDLVSEEDIAVALHSVAQLVESYGNKYWPIFERLERELKNKHSKAKRLNAALQKSSYLIDGQ